MVIKLSADIYHTIDLVLSHKKCSSRKEKGKIRSITRPFFPVNFTVCYRYVVYICASRSIRSDVAPLKWRVDTRSFAEFCMLR